VDQVGCNQSFHSNYNRVRAPKKANLPPTSSGNLRRPSKGKSPDKCDGLQTRHPRANLSLPHCKVFSRSLLIGEALPERQNMTRHSPYRSDKLSRLALSSEMSERHHTLWNQMFSGRPHAWRLFCCYVWRQPVFIPQINLVADLNDAVLRRSRVDLSPAMWRRVKRHNPAPHCLGAQC
jgi:hypothetical protein